MTSTQRRRPTPASFRSPWLNPAAMRENIRARVVESDSGCWIWRARGGSHGYAQASHRVDGRVVSELMHRVSYEVHVGPIPDDMEIDHRCNQPRCVNPEHLQIVTRAENIRLRDARKAAQ